jgi:hypothetical protein
LALEVLAAARRVSDVAGLGAWTSSLDVLERAPMGGAGELHRWVRDEVLEPAWQRTHDIAVPRWEGALDVVCAGVLATYVGADGAADPGAAWRQWTRTHPPATSAQPAVAHVVGLIRGTDPTSLRSAGVAMRTMRAAGWSWAAAMHDACWAIELTGRGRDVAVAQLEALDAEADVVGAMPLDGETVSAVTAAVHATAVADVLDSATVAAMCRPLLAHLG